MHKPIGKRALLSSAIGFSVASLNRIERLSGLDPRAYSGLTILMTMLRLLEIHQGVGLDV